MTSQLESKYGLANMTIVELVSGVQSNMIADLACILVCELCPAVGPELCNVKCMAVFRCVQLRAILNLSSVYTKKKEKLFTYPSLGLYTLLFFMKKKKNTISQSWSSLLLNNTLLALSFTLCHNVYRRPTIRIIA